MTTSKYLVKKSSLSKTNGVKTSSVFHRAGNVVHVRSKKSGLEGVFTL